MKSLRVQMIVLSQALVLLACLPIAFGGLWLSRRELEEELSHRLIGLAQAYAAHLEMTHDAGRLERLQADSVATHGRLKAEMTTFREATGLGRVRVVDKQLRVLVDTNSADTIMPAFDLEPERLEIDHVLQAGTATTSLRFEAEDGTLMQRGFAVLRSDGQVVGAVVAEGSAPFFEGLRDFALMVGIFLVVMLLSVAALTYRFSRRLTVPLGRLLSVTQRLEEGALETVVPSLGTNEVGDLARAIERMRAALAARDTQTQMLLAGIAHEVRNPLSGMELFVGLLEEDLRGDPIAHEKVERVRRELDYLKRVVEEFLAYSRNVRASTVRFGGRELLLEVAESCSCVAQAAGVRVVVQPAQIELTADREMLRGAVANVVLNAIQASSAGSVVRLELQQEGSFRVVEVVDGGRGMSAEVLSRANQPFFTTREKGTGLGLALAQKVAERHGGRLSVASTEGVGTTVRFSLPFDLAVPLAVEDAATSLGPDWIG